MNKYTCDKCNKNFSSEKTLETHKNKYHCLKIDIQNADVLNELSTNDNQILHFNNYTIKYFIHDNKCYYKARDIAKILKYVNKKDAIKKHVLENDKFMVSNLKKEMCNHDNTIKHTLKNEHPQTIFINENGLKALILKSNKSNSIELAKHLNINIVTKYLKKELETKEYEYGFYTDIEADMNVFGGTIPLDTKVIAPTNSTNFVVNKSVTGLVTSTALSFYDLNAIPIVGSYLRGQYIDFTKVTSVDLSALPLVTVTTEYPINPDLYLQTEPIDPDRKYAYTLSTDAGYNATGWYSYKVVVRQQEQEYYNVYLPGILSGYPSQFSITPVAATTIPVTTYPSGATLIQIQTSPNITIGYEIKLNSMYIATINSITSDPAGDILGVTPRAVSLTPSTNITIEKPENFIPFPNDPTSATANIVLINDNINKVPRDLAEVGPDQKQFRSSVQLFGRVTNIFQPDPLPVSTVVTASNKQYYPGIQSDTAVSISTAEDANVIYNELSDTPSTNFNVGGKDNLYQIDTNPLFGI